MHKIKFCLIAVTAMVLTAGCNLVIDPGSLDSGSTTATTDIDEPVSLSTGDDGGYDDGDEAPNFGIDSMQVSEDEETEDPSVTEEEEAGDEEEPGAQVYYLRLVWGNLALDGFEDEDRDVARPDWLDWSGTLTLSGGGGLILKRTVLFDRHDRVVYEENRKLVEWRSHTGPHIDGLLIKVIHLPDPEVADPKITFTTDLITQEIPIADLDHYNEIVTIDENGHGLAITGILKENDGCTDGFMQGKYHQRPEGDGGIFRGRFLSESGRLNGHLRGHYGVNDEGEKVFFGKYITEMGHFKGLLQGTYADGGFSGDWTDAGHVAEGTLNGKYVIGETVDSGFFQGFWEKNCGE